MDTPLSTSYLENQDKPKKYHQEVVNISEIDILIL